MVENITVLVVDFGVDVFVEEKTEAEVDFDVDDRCEEIAEGKADFDVVGFVEEIKEVKVTMYVDGLVEDDFDVVALLTVFEVGADVGVSVVGNLKVVDIFFGFEVVVWVVSFGMRVEPVGKQSSCVLRSAPDDRVVFPEIELIYNFYT